MPPPCAEPRRVRWRPPYPAHPGGGERDTVPHEARGDQREADDHERSPQERVREVRGSLIGGFVEKSPEDDRGDPEVREVRVRPDGRRRLGEVADRAYDVEAARATTRHDHGDQREDEPDHVGGDQ
jgi:hypothetical protein